MNATIRALVLPLMLLALGCHEDQVVNVVPADLPPHRVDGVYSVTGDFEVTIYWRANQENDISLYKVYRNSAPTGTFTLVGSTPQSPYVDHGVTNGVTYYYAVAAVDFVGQESAELSYENVFDTPRPEGFGVALTSTFDIGGDPNSGWDFSAYRTRPSLDVATDIYYGAADGHYLVYAGPSTDIQDAGFVALRDVDFAPPAGWSADGMVEAIPGHSYIVWTRDGHFAKFEVVSRDGLGMVMDWAYQIDPDNPELARRLK